MTDKNLLKFALFALCILFTACSDDEEKPPLPGKRISVMELQKNLEPDTQAEKRAFKIPAPWVNSYWPQSGGYPSHAMQNLGLNPGALKKAWSVDIGEGSSGRFPLTAQPVVVDGQIFTLDTDFSLRAFNLQTGKQLWETNVESKIEDDPVITGGLAFGEGLLYVTNGYNEIMAVRADNGKIQWRKPISTPSRAAPTIINGRVFITTLDSRVIAFNAKDGTQIWEYIGIAETAGLVGAASPAATSEIVVPVFTSGEIAALRVENGSVAWTDNLAKLQQAGGLTSISDIKALPVIDEDLVFAISFGGRLVAIDQRTGARVWQRDIGSSNTPWVADKNLFVLSSENDLVSLDRDNGVIRWVFPLPKYRKPDSKSDPLFWTGPVLAGNRLIIASTDGRIMEVDPANGKPIRSWESGDSVVLPLVVAGNTLYILSEDGTLSAYR